MGGSGHHPGATELVGAIPLLGDLFDAAYKANARNLALLHAHLEARARGGAAPSDRHFFWGVFLVVAGVLALTGLVLFGLIRALQAVLGP